MQTSTFERDPWLDSLGEDPIRTFEAWFKEAAAAGIMQPEAMTLATCTADGRPSARLVLMKGIRNGAFQFFTNFESRKSAELSTNPRASLVFFWEKLEREIRIEGDVSRITRQENEEYFKTRPRISQIGAWASRQSKELRGREDLLSRYREMEELFQGKDVPCPENWGGYAVMPHTIEFWQGRPGRLHDRGLFRRQDLGAASSTSGKWTKVRLSP